MSLNAKKHEMMMKENFLNLEESQMVLFCLSVIWKSGAEIVRDVDGGLLINNHEKIPGDCMRVANSIFDLIDNYLQSVEGMTRSDKTVYKMMTYLLGWQTNNENIKRFMLEDQIGFDILNEYQIQLMQNGWRNIYTDYRIFENDKSDKFKELLLKQLINFSKGSN